MTRLGVYLRDTGTSQTWLAEAVGVSKATVNNWTAGVHGMSATNRRKVLAVLRERAALSLDGLLADQRAPHAQKGGTPFDQFVRKL